MATRPALADIAVAPRLLTREQAAAYCGLSVQGFSRWVKSGRLPGPIVGTLRWDLRAIDAAFDSISGIANRREGGVNSSHWINGRQTMRVHLKGIHRVQRRLANGIIRVHYYAWRGGPKINAKPGTPRFIQQYNEAHRAVRRPKAGTLMTLIAEFKGSAEYRQLSPSSIRAYTTYIKLIADEFGDLPLAALEDLRVRGEFKTWRDRFANTPRKADYLGRPCRAFFRSARIAADRIQSVRGGRSAVHRRSGRQGLA